MPGRPMSSRTVISPGEMRAVPAEPRQHFAVSVDGHLGARRREAEASGGPLGGEVGDCATGHDRNGGCTRPDDDAADIAAAPSATAATERILMVVGRGTERWYGEPTVAA